MSDGSGIARLSQHDAVRRGEVLPIVPPTYEGPLAEKVSQIFKTSLIC